MFLRIKRTSEFIFFESCLHTLGSPIAKCIKFDSANLYKISELHQTLTKKNRLLHEIYCIGCDESVSRWSGLVLRRSFIAHRGESGTGIHHPRLRSSGVNKIRPLRGRKRLVGFTIAPHVGMSNARRMHGHLYWRFRPPASDGMVVCFGREREQGRRTTVIDNYILPFPPPLFPYPNIFASAPFRKQT